MNEPRRATSRSAYRAPARVVELTSPDFLETPSPEMLLRAPGRVHVAGDLSLLHGTRRVAIVGARDASPEGVMRARRLARLLADAGIVVVSGLARGIDHAAHTAAVEAGGRTIAVIGTPIDKAYPAEHGDLQAKIAAEHLLVSQFDVGSRVFQSNFIARNRLMALLVHASVIVEASDTSGSLSQAAETQRFDRPVFFMRSVLANEKLAWPSRFLAHAHNPARVLEDVAQVINAVR